MTTLATIERSDVEVTPTSWQPSGEMDFEDWCEAGARLGQMAEAIQWWIGDWINYGETAYGEKYENALEAMGYEKGSLMNMASLAREFETSRRREVLSWSHHAAVQSLDSTEQDTLLDYAEQQSVSVMKLRQAINGNGAKPKDHDLVLRLRFEQSFDNEALRRRTAQALRTHAEKLGFREKRA